MTPKKHPHLGVNQRRKRAEKAKKEPSQESEENL